MPGEDLPSTLVRMFPCQKMLFICLNELLIGPDGIPDGNPEAVMIGSPIDGTKNPQPALGVGLSDITGVVTYQ